ncbi:MAG: hypothetical protein IPH82_13385 [Chloroflexi bacterium]|nr:hypothetical protein [Chloroflexota bacterium]
MLPPAGPKAAQSFLCTELASPAWMMFCPALQTTRSSLFSWPLGQTLLFLLVLAGGFCSGLISFSTTLPAQRRAWALLTLLLANLLVIGFHELAHGLTVKRVGRELNRAGFFIYWGFPAFLSIPATPGWVTAARIAVSWAGPFRVDDWRADLPGIDVGVNGRARRRRSEPGPLSSLKWASSPTLLFLT